ncbi:DUF6745 domain-containing protein [Actinomadura xylanilytica]|uniref:DUF6745 domain-containing protein n=1 Tax=Actinomadura xylanilytica TaxID=887459 RepID=UPI00255AF568|nr:hypothetical protein [Actinomadura xylanilytica]MDL4773116.1 hypothetical protein [Actinomadura xylanilytica]
MSGPGATRASAKHRSAERWQIDQPPGEVLDRAIALRDDWLGRALCTLPADRPAAEAAITELYRLVGQRAPRFVWVDSPGAAADAGLIPKMSLPQDWTAPGQSTVWPLAARLATLASTLRHTLDECFRRRLPRWPLGSFLGWQAVLTLPPRESLREGASLSEILQVTVRDTLRGTVHESLGRPQRVLLNRPAMAWYGLHEAHWVAEHDILRTLSRSRIGAATGAQLDLWIALARSCGWWWPDEDVCVVSERPAAVHAEPVPGSAHGELRLHSGKGRAIRYADGWGPCSWHGTLVPSWVIEEPTVERILAEPNAEVRRCAIERIGWDVYIDRAGLRLVSTAPDPGNPGCLLRLYDLPFQSLGSRARVLLAVNGSVERDGTRRRYGLSVPADLDDPVAAAGWSYGLTRDQYARLLRRT